MFLLADQKTNEGIGVPFFGRDAMTTPAPAMLALKLGATLLPASNERVGGARLTATIHPPIDFTPTGDSERDVYLLTRAITESLEKIIRERPSQWLWLHRRWPTTRATRTTRWASARVQTLDANRRACRARGIEPDLKPVHRPMQMRPRCAARMADEPDDLTAFHRIAALHQLLALMQVAGEHAMPVIEHGIATFEIELLRQRHDRIGGRADFATLARRDIDTEMRRGRFAVEDALAAELAADDAVPANRTDRRTSPRRCRLPGPRRDERMLALDPALRSLSGGGAS